MPTRTRGEGNPADDRRRRGRRTRLAALAAAGIAASLLFAGCADQAAEASRAEVDAAKTKTQTDTGEIVEWGIVKVDGDWFCVPGEDIRGFEVVTYVRCPDGIIRTNGIHSGSLEVIGDAEGDEQARAVYHIGSKGLLELHLPPSAIG